MRSCALLIVLLLPQLSVAGTNRVPVSKLLDQMIRRSTLAEPGGSPFYLKATIIDKDDAKSEFNGALEEYWLSPTKWRRVVKLRDFSQTRIACGTSDSPSSLRNSKPAMSDASVGPVANWLSKRTPINRGRFPGMNPKFMKRTSETISLALRGAQALQQPEHRPDGQHA
jgi:hypothetical protein